MFGALKVKKMEGVQEIIVVKKKNLTFASLILMALAGINK